MMYVVMTKLPKHAKLSELTKRFNQFSDNYEALHSELKITQNCNSVLLEHVYQLERNALSNLQYHRRETLEINPVPSAIQNNVLGEAVCQALSLTGINLFPDELHLWQWLSKKDRGIVKFKIKKHKQKVLFDRKNMQSKGPELTQLKFPGKLFVNERVQEKFILRGFTTTM